MGTAAAILTLLLLLRKSKLLCAGKVKLPLSLKNDESEDSAN